ncbi:MAG TPA: hypothetical protein VMV92_17390 [Streptosporangiaceae bacterium]|nr:hypothetical protein [Streptosporangiaceae bacterium]
MTGPDATAGPQVGQNATAGPAASQDATAGPDAGQNDTADPDAGAPFRWSPEEIRRTSHRVADMVADYLIGLPHGPVYQPPPRDLVCDIRAAAGRALRPGPNPA